MGSRMCPGGSASESMSPVLMYGVTLTGSVYRQCARRGLVCKFPKESRRGMHKRGPRAQAAALADSTVVADLSTDSPDSPNVAGSSATSMASMDSELAMALGPPRAPVASSSSVPSQPREAPSRNEKSSGSARTPKSGTWDPVVSAKRRAAIREDRKIKVSARRERERVQEDISEVAPRT